VNRCGRSARFCLGSLAAAAAAAFLLLSGCSSDIGYPAVHDMPAPRAETPLTPDQIKQATDDLVSQREHLNTEATTGQVTPVNLGSTNASTTSPAPKPSRPAPPAAAQTGTPDGSMTAGAYAKP
jgi:hypothetical protein